MAQMAFVQAGTCASQRLVDDASFIAHLQSSEALVATRVSLFICGKLPRIKVGTKCEGRQEFLRESCEPLKLGQRPRRAG